MWRTADPVGGVYQGGYLAWKDIPKNGWNRDSASLHEKTKVVSILFCGSFFEIFAVCTLAELHACLPWQVTAVTKKKISFPAASLWMQEIWACTRHGCVWSPRNRQCSKTQIAETVTRRYFATIKAPYIYDSGSRRFLGFENVQSLQHKVNYAIEKWVCCLQLSVDTLATKDTTLPLEIDTAQLEY